MSVDVSDNNEPRTLREMAADAAKEAGVGLACPNCGCRDTRVVTIRHNIDGSETRRRRECRYCGERLTTFEAIP